MSTAVAALLAWKEPARERATGGMDSAGRGEGGAEDGWRVWRHTAGVRRGSKKEWLHCVLGNWWKQQRAICKRSHL